jgi:predicted  nucleic acid-binding Zn-ribbon protein
MKEIEDLEKEKNNLNAHKERIESELQQKEELLRIEQKEKEHLESMIREMEQKVVMGGQAFEEREKEQSKAYREY